MLDVRVFVAVWAGVVGLALGVVAAVISSPVLAVLAGAAAVGAGATAAWAGSALRGAEERAAEAERRGSSDRRALEAGADRVADAERRADEAERRLAEALASTSSQAAAHQERVERLEQELEAARRAAREAPAGASTPESLTDATTGLFSESYFRVALDARISAARRHLRPVAVVLLDVVDGTEAGASERSEPMRVAESVLRTLRDADTACRMDDGTFALVLEDTPENGAVWTVERVRRTLAADYPEQTMWAGVACYPAHAFSTDELLDRATAALDAAREWKQDRIEVAIAE